MKNFNLFNNQSIIFLLFGLFFSVIIYLKPEDIITLNFKSNYYVISKKLILTTSIIYFLIIALLYFIRTKQLNRKLTKIHIITTVLSLVLILIFILLLRDKSENYDIISIIHNSEFNSKIEKSIWVTLPIFLVSQLVFIINFVMSFFSNQNPLPKT